MHACFGLSYYLIINLIIQENKEVISTMEFNLEFIFAERVLFFSLNFIEW